MRVDGVKMEPGISKMEEDRVKREHVENMLEEERDGVCMCVEYSKVHNLCDQLCIISVF